jgi:Mg-chelatase subunit ChlD
MAWLFWRKIRWQEAVLRIWYKSQARQPKEYRFRRWFRALRSIFLLASLAGLWLALARPLQSDASSTTTQDALDLIVVLDVSASMQRKDLLPSRWQQALLAIETLRQTPTQDRIALIAFAGEAGIQCPWTHDRIALQELAWQTKPGVFAEQGDGLAEALQLAHQLFSRPQPQPAPRALLLLSDGFPQSNYATHIDNLQKQGVQVMIVETLPSQPTAAADGWTPAQQQSLKRLASAFSAPSLSLSQQNLDELLPLLQRIPRTPSPSLQPHQASELFIYPLAASFFFLLGFLALLLLPAREVA